MRISVHGTDKGNALLLALVLIIILSTAVMSLIPRILATKEYARAYKADILRGIEEKNREILNRYDLR